MAIECLVLGISLPLLLYLLPLCLLLPIHLSQFTCLCICIVCLGAGQEVGKSCVVVSINGKRIMFDCGMHMGYDDHRRYPDFSLISTTGDFDSALDCVIVTHL